ncbi:GNAT family N-acetyltransferase [Atlantibacter hermannii]|uniref:GNAT family N-acetyltransferase n=1 Tax=Atlantibacter hermannii TaxID=565 RepID=UPI0005C319E3|nr:GNAT family N-acetyltransferase [Atlantibacter hermannii]KIU31703.1 hypothetical protein SR38_16475 [Atlantibacter hermannii]MEB7925835.1 GNAT family N-acetyltransferase [Atlantibacter hermannii]HAP80927.1 N-acetyltransferase [Enterobacteriaceae bacterium]
MDVAEKITLRIEPFDLNKTYRYEDFCCGVIQLDTFLKQQMPIQQARRILRCYVLVTNETVPEILGFYTLYGASYERTHLSASQQRKLPYKNLPCVLLGRLAIDQRAQGYGFGEKLIFDAIKRTWLTAGVVGIHALFVEAKDDKAVEFYRSLGFIISRQDTRTMFFPCSQFEKLSFSVT